MDCSIAVLNISKKIGHKYLQFVCGKIILKRYTDPGKNNHIFCKYNVLIMPLLYSCRINVQKNVPA